jgi:glycosyltransferase involved in cell wall biosynthesis
MPQIAILLPAYNEAVAISQTIDAFRQALPHAHIYVYDNNSSDETAARAAAVGADVRHEKQQGKGHVVRRMFADIEADIYIMADADATYDAAAAPTMVEKLCAEHLDMIVGVRKDAEQAAYRHGHRFGNKLLTGALTWAFGNSFSDILSGYRVFSRRFVKSFPVLSTGFEIETEISVHALALNMPVGEMETHYAARPVGSHSKLNTYRDGWRILRTILNLLRTERPLFFYSAISAKLVLITLVLVAPLLRTYLATHMVPRLPTALLATGLMIVAALSFMCGLILDTVGRGRRELRRLAYLRYPAP